MKQIAKQMMNTKFNKQTPACLGRGRKAVPHRLKKVVRTLAAGLVMSAALVGTGTAQAQFVRSDFTATVKLPNAEYIESTVDMRVKVLGGEVALERTWRNGRWYLNSSWANLRFIADPLGSSVQTIDRAGTLYTRSGTTDVYAFSDIQAYIRKTDTGWRWYDRDGNWITYDSAGRMTGYGDHNGVQVSFELDGEGRRVGVKDHHGQTIYTLNYDANERLVQAQDANGRTVLYTWQGDRLLTVTDVLGHEWHYGYDGNGQLNQRTEPDGGIIRIGYASSVPAADPAMVSGKNAAGLQQSAVANTGTQTQGEQVARVGTYTDKTGAVTLWNTDYNRVVREYAITMEDPLGVQTTSRYNIEGKLISRSVNGELQVTMERDGDYQTKTIDARRLTTTVQYNRANNPLKIIRPDGAVETFEYDDNLNKPTRYTDALGQVTIFAYDSNGNLLQSVEAAGTPEQRTGAWVYDAYGQPTQFTLRQGNDTIELHLAYDPNGNVSTLTDGKGYNYHFGYNTLGQLISATNPLNHSWMYTYNAAGHPLSSTDPLGHVTRYETDALGRVTQATDARGNTSTYTYVFNATGTTITQTNALGQSVSYQYDITGKLVSTTLPSGLTSRVAYDNQGRLHRMTDAAGNETAIEYGAAGSGLDGMVVGVIYPTYRETYKYNALGLPTQVSQVLGTEPGTGNNATVLTYRTGYDAMGQTVSMTDAMGRTAQTEYDALGNPILYTDVLGGQTLQAWNLTGQVTRVTDANGNTHQFEYDANGNLTQETIPMGQATRYSYDAANQLTQMVDAAGNTTAYAYDAAGRLVQKSYTVLGEAQPQQAISYQYNEADQLIEVVQSGSTNSHHVYARDELGRITQEQITYGQGSDAFTLTLGYSYTADGELQRLTYPDGSVQSHAYENGQLQTVTLPNELSMVWNGYEWLRPTQVNYPGTEQTLSYDPLQRMQNIDIQAGQNTLMSRGYTYDAAGNIIQRQTEEGEFTYGYDQLDQLIQAVPPQNLQNKLPVEGYAYDAVHNRIGSSQQAGAWEYNANNQLMQYGSGSAQVSYTYTETGHIATATQAGQITTYHYDASDRLVSISKNGVEIASYQYDPFGRRISKTVNGQTTYYLYTDEGLIAEIDDQGNMLVAYGWQPGSMYGTAPLWQVNLSSNNLQTAEFHYLHTDHLGTVQMATNGNGEITWKAQSEAFGRTLLNEQNQITMNLRFPGQYFDQETGIHYNYFRDYSPQIGRYIQRDPIGLNAGVNVYSYVLNTPLKFYDPEGKLNPAAVVGWGISGISGGYAGYVAGQMNNSVNSSVVPTYPGLVALPRDREEAQRWQDREYAQGCRDRTGALVNRNTLREANRVTDIARVVEGQMEAIEDQRRYHDECDQKNPYQPKTCEWAVFNLAKAEACLEARKSWVDKWVDFDIRRKGHLNYLEQLRRQINNASNQVQQLCK
ncbi:Putative deoxyribonuclease RhsC [Saezia sanguinis]|uniref:Deoxyribonuclease RhsC n=1 Tax=Saezia sanguinis TaxID=1965230 RepID=A0A433SGH4_9BURK|nr:RHS repeat-associated core domain-containing protein [Saezia sanguinis]RUS67838.1 Putative deoxyribonuclease RhsC [Saezia sanguinis]